MKKIYLLLFIGLTSTCTYAQWSQVGGYVYGNNSTDDRLGSSVSISSDGQTYIVSSPFNDDGTLDAGKAQVFDWDGSNWNERGASIYGGYDEWLGNGRSTAEISADGNTIAVGIARNDAPVDDEGEIKVFDWDGSNWVQRGSDINGDAQNDVLSKVAISTDANTIVVGASGSDGNGTNSGQIKVFDWNGISWVQRGSDIFGPSGYQLGSVVDISSDGNIISGSSSGSGALVFEWNGSAWTQMGANIISPSPTAQAFGASIELTSNGNTIIIGDPFEDVGGNTNIGSARVLDWNGTSWVQRGSLLVGDAASDYLGMSVSVSGDGNTIAAGATHNDASGSNAGKVKIFSWNGSSWGLESEILSPTFLSSFGGDINLSSNGERIVIGGARYQSDRGLAGVFGAPSCATSNTITVNNCDTYTVPSGDETYTAVGSYQIMDTILNAQNCDSILTINLTINSSNTGLDIQTACDSYTWIDGNTYTASNNTATHILTNAAGCDSMVTLDLTVNYSTSGADIQTACDSYTWIDGNTYTASNNTATHILTNAAGCDSIVTLDLTVNYSTSGTDIQTACDSYTWIDGNTYTASNNTATHILTNAAGCDSMVTLDLTVNYSTSGTDIQTACDSYTWIDGNTYTASNNTATHILTNAAGCDSMVTLDLTVNYSTSGADIQTACDSYIWIDGNTYTASNNTATHILTNAAGCDSIVTLDLTVNYSTSGADIQTACDSYTWIDGNTYTASNNTATHILTNAAGCDSMVTLDLTVNYSTSGADIQTACDSYTWIDGITYTASNNTATHILTNAAGCDSIVTLNLTINNVSNLTTSITGITISANNSGATYQWLNCDNNYSMISGETNSSYTTSVNGNYAVQLTENGCIDTSACVTITTVGFIENNFGNDLIVYPNPTNGNFSIDLGAIYENTSILITDLSGKLIVSKNITQSQVLNLSIDEPKGIYLISIQKGDKKAVIRLIME